MEGVVTFIIVVVDITYAFYFVCFRSLQKNPERKKTLSKTYLQTSCCWVEHRSC